MVRVIDYKSAKQRARNLLVFLRRYRNSEQKTGKTYLTMRKANVSIHSALLANPIGIELQGSER
jgi:hypothetical protein